MAILSICITVYNQIEIVKQNLDQLHLSKNQDFIVIVNDDCSSENISQLVKSYNDARIEYYRNSHNLGHDINILEALSHCKTDYVMLLRSRDFLLTDKIDVLIQELKRDRLNTSYFLFSAIDENKRIKLRLSDKVFCNDDEKIYANSKLLVHPSGSIYQTKHLDLQLYRSYISRFFGDSKYGFCVHNLIRMDLIRKKNFYISSKVIWQYTNTHKSADVAQNSSKQNISVYAPSYVYPRIKCEYFFVKENFSGRVKNILIHQIIKKYYIASTIDFIEINKNKELQKHYNYDEISFDPFAEHSRFKKNVGSYCNLPDFNDYLNKLYFENLIIKRNLRPIYRFFKLLIKKIMLYE